METPSGTLAWKIPWTEEPDGLQSMGLQRIRHNRATKHNIFNSMRVYRGISDMEGSNFNPTPWQVAGLRGRWDRNWRQAGRRWIRFIRVYILKPKGNAGKTSVGRWAWKFFSSLLLMPCFSHLFLPSGMTSGWSEGASALSGCLHIYKARFHVWAFFILITFCVLSCFSHVRLCDPMEYSLPDSSVHGVLQARILELSCYAILQRIFLTQGLNSRLLCLQHWQFGRWILYH